MLCSWALWGGRTHKNCFDSILAVCRSHSKVVMPVALRSLGRNSMLSGYGCGAMAHGYDSPIESVMKRQTIGKVANESVRTYKNCFDSILAVCGSPPETVMPVALHFLERNSMLSGYGCSAMAYGYDQPWIGLGLKPVGVRGGNDSNPLQWGFCPNSACPHFSPLSRNSWVEDQWEFVACELQPAGIAFAAESWREQRNAIAQYIFC
eukprot:Gb_33826 [translate_table: standard]